MECVIPLSFVHYLFRWHRRLPIEDQRCFCDFVLVAGDKYEDDRKLEFIRDLLKLKHFPLNLSSGIDKGVYESFCSGLQKFVIVNKLKSDVCGLLVEVSTVNVQFVIDSLSFNRQYFGNAGAIECT